MKHCRIGLCVLAGLLALSSAGCIVVGIGGWSCTTHWTEGVTEELRFDTTDVEGLEVRTHNGKIRFEGESTGNPEAIVTVTKKGGGCTFADAEEALAAIEVYIEDVGERSRRIAWKWNPRKRSGWSARVSFEIHAPGALNFDAKTHNGSITVADARGDVRVVTHNGGVNVTSAGGTLDAETHNGKLAAAYVGDDVTLLTHNGRITADLSGCESVRGTVTTHNGSIEVLLGEKVSAELACRTHNGGISCNVPLEEINISRGRLSGKVGAGEGRLAVTTHNGSVRIKSAPG